MDTTQLRQQYQRFFEGRGHCAIPSAPLLPENDPTVLFTTAGMQPLVPYLLGESHPMGQRLVNVQRCIRTNDIEEVGDPSHLTFFEMLGNWSLGDYFKRESLAWSYEFLTRVLGIAPGRLAVTVFAGDADAPRDDTSAGIWRALGLPPERIFFLPKADNWWGPVGNAGPCGPDSEIFFDTGRPDHPGCRPGCACGKWFEIWNNVFMEYNKLDGRQAEKRYEKLSRPNVDTGMGVERTVAVLNGYDDIFYVDTLFPLVQRLEALTGRGYVENPLPFRLIVDHLRASAMAIADGARPSNVEAGYVVRRMLRRAVVYGGELGAPGGFLAPLAETVLDLFAPVYPGLEAHKAQVVEEIEREESKFQRTLQRGLQQYHKAAERAVQAGAGSISGEDAFDLFQTYGFPLPLTQEMARERGLVVDQPGFERLYAEHKELSRQGSGRFGEAGRFKGGLADHSEQTTRYHTATHLLHAALRQVLGEGVGQKGSNITPERLRFDFSFPRKLSPEELQAVEQLVNAHIAADLPVSFTVMSLEQAQQAGALAFFGEKYGEQVKVYTVGAGAQVVSREVCGGPHVTHTGELGQFRIVKEEAVGQGVRRIRAVLA